MDVHSILPKSFGIENYIPILIPYYPTIIGIFPSSYDPRYYPILSHIIPQKKNRYSHDLPMTSPRSFQYYPTIIQYYPTIIGIFPSYSHDLPPVSQSVSHLDPVDIRSRRSSAVSLGSRHRWRDRRAPQRRPRSPPCAPWCIFQTNGTNLGGEDMG